MLDAKAVRYFVTVVEAGSFRGAAERLGLAQPSISERVRLLEQELGYALLDRSHRQIQLTAQGAGFLEIARRFLLELHRLSASARQIGGRKPSRIAIGCSSTGSAAPERDLLIDEFMQSEPELSIRVLSLEPKALLEAFWRAEIDLVILGGPLPDAVSANRRLLLGDQYAILFVPEESPLAALDKVPLEALEGQTIACFPAISHPELCYDVYRVLREHGASLLEVPEVSFISLQNFARRRNICALTVDSMAGFAMQGQVPRPIEGDPFRSPLYLLEPRADASQAARRLWQFAQRRQLLRPDQNPASGRRM